MRWRAVLVVVAVLASLALATGVAQGATLKVTTTSDSGAPGSGSLREEIAAANPGDTVMLPASSKPYMVTLGEIPVTNAITIEGAGAGSSVIDANHLSRVFSITSGVVQSSTVTFENLTIENGSDTVAPGGGGILIANGGLALTGVAMTGNTVNVSPSASSVGGGAVYSEASGPGITVTGSKLTGNSATVADPSGETSGGAAIYQNGVAPITISGSTISSNMTTITGSKCCDGGAVYLNANSTITVTGSHLDDNTYTETGGTDGYSGGAALYNDGGGASNVTITGTTLNGNTANVSDNSDNNCCDGAGAIFMYGGGTLTLNENQLNHDATTVSSGDCCSGGGAINSVQTIDATDTTFLSDTATVSDANCCDGGGAVLIDDSQTQSTFVGSEFEGNSTSVTSTDTSSDCCNGGGAISSDSSLGTLTLSSSDISDNTAGGNSADESGGGGMWIDDGGGNTLTDSTLSGDRTTFGGPSDGGGAIALIAGATKLSFVTIAGSAASQAPGGGIFNDAQAVDTKNSIVASNTGVGGGDCAGVMPTFTSLGYNLEDSPDTCGFTQPTDKVVAAATLGLGPLENNGGPTMTEALLAGSPAINAIPFADCTDQSTPTPQPVAMDQRGVTRPQPAGGNCDIGAYEFGDVALASNAPLPVPEKPFDGSTTTITWEVVNAGPAPATHTTATWTLPAGLKFVSGTASGGSCTATATGASCPLGVVSVGTPATSSIILRPTKPAGDLTSKLVVTATEPNTTPSSDTQDVNIASIGVTPTIKQLKQSHKTWRESGHGHKPPVGTKFSFKLNEPAKLSLKFTGKHGKSAGTLSANGRAGSNTIKFAGRLSRKKKLKPGRYTVAITAKAEGKTSRAAKLSFTIARA